MLGRLRQTGNRMVGRQKETEKRKDRQKKVGGCFPPSFIFILIAKLFWGAGVRFGIDAGLAVAIFTNENVIDCFFRLNFSDSEYLWSKSHTELTKSLYYHRNNLNYLTKSIQKLNIFSRLFCSILETWKRRQFCCYAGLLYYISEGFFFHPKSFHSSLASSTFFSHLPFRLRNVDIYAQT